MKIIEVIGPNGAGKTTLATALVRAHTPAIGRTEALRRCARYWTGKSDSWKCRTRLYPALKLAGRTGVSLPLNRAVALELAGDLVKRSQEEHQAFLAHALSLAGASEKAGLSRIKAVHWLMKTFEETILLAATPVDATVILDESLCHMIYGVSSIALFDESGVSGYFQLMPLPFAVIHVSASLEEHLDNVRCRAADGRVMIGHRDVINDETALKQDLANRCGIDRLALATLKQRNVPCIEYRSRIDAPQAVIAEMNGLLA